MGVGREPGDQLMLKLVPLGGLGEIGLNCMVLEHHGERMLIDCGLMFPRGDFPGVELVLPDFRWLLEAPEQLKGVVLTHAHEDHLGALPWLISRANVPVYGTRFTLALARHRLSEAGLEGRLEVLEPRQPFRVGNEFGVELIRVTHSIPDAVAVSVRTTSGSVLHSGDFKLDLEPIDGELTDLTRLDELGDEGVDLLLSDSTGAEAKGSTPSEARVRETFARLITPAKGRVVVGLFGSHLHRVEHLLRLAARTGRKVVLAGRSLQRNVQLAIEAGMLEVEQGLLMPADLAATRPESEVLVLAAGAQGEPRSALSNMLSPDPGPLKARAGDTLLLSSRVIPGNEVAVADLLDRFVARGAKVVHPGLEPLLHVSGHAAREEQRKVMQTVRPKAFVPVHGERRQLVAHLELAAEVAIAQRVLAIDGDVMGVSDGALSSLGQVPAGRVLSWRDSEDELPLPSLEERRALAYGVVFVCVAIDPTRLRVVSGPAISGRGLTAEETAALGLAENDAKAALGALGSLLADDAKVREEVTAAVKRTLRQTAGSRATVVPLVLKV